MRPEELELEVAARAHPAYEAAVCVLVLAAIELGERRAAREKCHRPACKWVKDPERPGKLIARWS